MRSKVVVGMALLVFVLVGALLGWRWARMAPCREVLDECKAMCARLGLRGRCMEDCIPPLYCYTKDGKLITADHWFSIENMTSVLRKDFEEYLEEEAYSEKIIFFDVAVTAETKASIEYAIEVTLDDEWGKEVAVKIRSWADKGTREYDWEIVGSGLNKFSVGRMAVAVRPLVEELIHDDCAARGHTHHRVGDLELESGGIRGKWKLFKGTATATDNGLDEITYRFHVEADTMTDEASVIITDRALSAADYRLYDCITTWSHPGGRERKQRPVCVASPEYLMANALVMTCRHVSEFADHCWEKAEPDCKRMRSTCEPW